MVDAKLERFFKRRLRLEEAKREVSDDIKDLKKEMKGVGLLPAEMKGIELKVGREFEAEAKRVLRVEAEDVAESLGQLADTPLGKAAIIHIKEYAD